jgi:Ig-like domain-containing protein/immunoglobulin I-set domain protein
LRIPAPCKNHETKVASLAELLFQAYTAGKTMTKLGILICIAVISFAQLALAQFYPGNLAVLRAGDGVQILTNSGNQIFVDQYTRAGALVNTIAIPTNGPQSLLISGKASSEGFINLSSDKHLITLVGYNTNLTAASTNSLADSLSSAVPRAIATIDYLGNYHFITNTTTFFSANNIRSGITDGTNNFWVAGAASGTVYLGLNTTSAVLQSVNTEVVGIFNGNLYYSSQKTSLIGIYAFKGIPTTANADMDTFLPVSGPASPSPYAFAISPDGNTVYVADDNSIAKHGGIQKYVNTSQAWSLVYTLATGTNSTTGARGLTVDFSGAQPILYATTADSISNKLISIVDTGASSVATVLATAGANQLFRGVQFIPQGYAPTITVQPQSQTVPAGQPVSFSVTASGSATPAYQWLFNSNSIPGATNFTLTFNSADTTNAGDYQVVITNSWGAITSLVSVLSIGSGIPIPEIIAQPFSQTNNATSIATFSVTGRNTISSYQWQKNGTNFSDAGKISGSAAATLTISNVLAADAGIYRVILTNASGSATSSPAILAVIDPLIVSPPIGRTYLPGATVTLQVQAVGTPSLLYQWYLNGAVLTNATGNTLQITNLQSADAGNYSVIVSNPAGSALSSNAAVLIALPRTFFLPANLVVLRGGDGFQTLTNSGNTLFLDQFTTNGSYVSTMNIPDSGTNALLISGTSSSEGYLTLSDDGKSLVIAGYNIARGSIAGSLSSTNAAAVPRGIAQIDGFGNYSLVPISTNQYSGEHFHSAFTDGNNNFWGADSDAGISYFGFQGSATTLQGALANCRVIEMIDHTYLAFSAQTETPGIYIFDGPPPTAAEGITLVIGTGKNSSPEDFAFASGDTVAYIADDSDAGGIQRWQLIGGVWTPTYTLHSGALNIGIRSFAADFSGSHPVLYAITAEDEDDDGPDRLITITDTGSNSVAATLDTAGFNQHFFAVKFAPKVQPLAATLSGPVFSGDSQFSFYISGTPGYDYVIQTSTNLADWTSIATNVVPFVFTNGTTPASPARFYRALSAPP